MHALPLEAMHALVVHGKHCSLVKAIVTAMGNLSSMCNGGLYGDEMDGAQFTRSRCSAHHNVPGLMSSVQHFNNLSAVIEQCLVKLRFCSRADL